MKPAIPTTPEDQSSSFYSKRDDVRPRDQNFERQWCEMNKLKKRERTLCQREHISCKFWTNLEEKNGRRYYSKALASPKCNRGNAEHCPRESNAFTTGHISSVEINTGKLILVLLKVFRHFLGKKWVVIVMGARLWKRFLKPSELPIQGIFLENARTKWKKAFEKSEVAVLSSKQLQVNYG